MDSGTLNIAKIFGQDRRHVVPLFQRPYVWNKEEQWEPLWNDILTVADRLLANKEVKPHFLGAIVLDQMRKPTGHLETRLLIDGQQRLTTAQLLLESFADICERFKVEKYHKALLKLTRNDDPMSEDADEQFKVWPTNTDQDHFRRLMRAGSRDEVKKLYGKKNNAESVGHALADAYLFFSDVFENWLRPDKVGFEIRVDALYRTLREHLRMVVIDLDEQDDAQVIFETLNARGTPLLPSDLVKNFLFHRADAEDIEQLYKHYWQPFDTDSKYWRRQQGRGHARRAKIDLFLQNYLTARKRDDVPTAHLYTTFREWASDPENGTATDHLNALQSYAQMYKQFDFLPIASRERLFFDRLEVMDISSAHPFLLELFVKFGSENPAVLEAIIDIESFLVRRMVCGLNTRGYNRLFVDMLGKLGDKTSPSQRIRQFLLSSQADSSRWPKDEEFLKNWKSRPLSLMLVRGRVRMLLEALERHLHSPKTEKLQFGEILQIEHIMPQEWQKYWPLPPTKTPEDATQAMKLRESAIHVVGNLTLLTEKLNPSISNGPWDKKRPAILEHSALNLNRKLAYEWNEEAIESRSETLFKVARQVWPYPG
jgi:hypothetical protein